MTEFPARHPISRARFFLERAVECSVQQCDEHEAYLEAAIVFGRTALLRLEAEYNKHPDWKVWWAGLLSNTSVNFLRNERNWIRNYSRDGQARAGVPWLVSDRPEPAAASRSMNTS